VLERCAGSQVEAGSSFVVIIAGSSTADRVPQRQQARTHLSELKASAPERDGLPCEDNTNLRRIETSLGLRLSDEWISAAAEAKQVGVSVCKARTRHPCSASAIE
jgi:hypothetical protein